jgi:glycosyltransferase involved in cell wall biosynthesis
MSDYFDVTVLAPGEGRAAELPADRFQLARASSALGGLDPFRGSADLNQLPSANLKVKAAAVLSIAMFACRAWRLARNCDAICAHWLVPCGLIGAIVGRLLRKPLIVVEHSGALHFLKQSTPGRVILRWIVKSSSSVVTVSEDLKRKLLAVVDGENDLQSSHGDISVLPMGVRTEILKRASTSGCEPGNETTGVYGQEHDARTHPATVLFVGRLTAIKGVSVLLRAISLLSDTRLIVAGEGELRCELERESKRLGIETVFTGRVDAQERKRLLESCDLVVIPSITLPGGRTEGLPLVCLEAMAAAKPVVASRTGGLAEIIVDRRNGLLVEPFDHIDLAAKIGMLLKDAALRDELAENAARTAREFDWSVAGRGFASVISDAMAKCSRPGTGNRTTVAADGGLGLAAKLPAGPGNRREPSWRMILSKRTSQPARTSGGHR